MHSGGQEHYMVLYRVSIGLATQIPVLNSPETSGQRSTLPAWNDLSDENSFTITCWVYATQIQDGSVIEKWTGGPYPVNIRAGSQPVLGFGMYDGTGTGFGTHTTYPYVGEWVFIVANFDFPSSTIRTILNMSDSTITSLPNSNYSNNTPLSIGRRMNRTDRFWYGKIDEITLWNRTLEPWELQQIFNGPTPGCTDPSSCNFNSEANVNDGSCIPVRLHGGRGVQLQCGGGV